jgi:hypothetical protein
MENSRIISNFFSESQINKIYDYVDSCPIEKIVNNKKVGQQLYYIPAFDMRESGDSDLWDTVEKKAFENSGKNLKILGIQFCRYTLDTGVAPSLSPHYDVAFDKEVLTLDIQLKKFIVGDWPIVVEKEKYILQDNQALIFSGTHEVHWREKRTFAKGEYLDMIFAHLCDPDSDDIKDSHKTNMKIKSNYYLKMWEMERA